jgi:G3E family GTPase
VLVEVRLKMRDFNEPYYSSNGCVCCEAPEGVVEYRERLLEALKQEQERSRLGFIQYKTLERIINGSK